MAMPTNNNLFANFMSALSPEQREEFRKAMFPEANTSAPTQQVSTPTAPAQTPVNPPSASASYNAPQQSAANASPIVSTPIPQGAIKMQQNYLNIVTPDEASKAAEMCKTLFKSFSQGNGRTADGGFYAWNMGSAGGFTMCYVSQFAMKRILNGERPDVTSYNMDEMAGEHNILSMQRVILDICAGNLALIEKGIHLYPHTDGKFSDRAGYAYLYRGALKYVSGLNIEIVKPVYGQVVDGDNGNQVVTYDEADWGTKTGYVVLKSTLTDPKKFYCGRVVVEPATAECWTPAVDKNGCVKTYVNRWGKTVTEMRKTKKGEDMDVIRRHTYLDVIAQGNVIYITDWYNRPSDSPHVEEKGVGEMTLFMRKIAMDSTWLHIRKNEVNNAYDAVRGLYNQVRKQEAAAATGITKPVTPDSMIDPASGQEKAVYVPRVFNKNGQPVEMTRSQLVKAGKYVDLKNGRITNNAVITMSERIVDHVIDDLMKFSNIGIQLIDC